jgi:phenylacetate-CoA ligase
MKLYYRIFNPFFISDILFGTSIYKYHKRYKLESFLSRSQVQEIQKEKLLELVDYAVKNIPYYQNLDLKVEYTSSIDQLLSQFPIINKKVINDNIEQFYSNKQNIRNLNTLYSGGSSGKPGKVFISKTDHSKLRALILILWERTGYKLGDPIIQLGMSRKRSLLKKLKDLTMNVTYEEAFKVNEETVRRVLQGKEITPNTCFIGYASGLYEYARIAKKLGIKVKFKSVISLGDKMFDHYRVTIEDVFETRVFDTYGSNEGFVVGGQHIDGHYYVNDTHVILEIVDNNYNKLPVGEMGRLLITSLDNFTMPLIRFDIGDILALNPYQDESTLPFSTIKQIIGRDVDIIKTKNGYSLIVHFFTAVFGKITEIEQFRVIQETIEKLTVEIIPALNFREEILNEIETELLKDLPLGEINVQFKKVNNIPVSGSGKPQILKSLLN